MGNTLQSVCPCLEQNEDKKDKKNNTDGENVNPRIELRSEAEQSRGNENSCSFSTGPPLSKRSYVRWCIRLSVVPSGPLMKNRTNQAGFTSVFYLHVNYLKRGR